MRVIAVEPVSENIRYIERHIRLNGIRNIEVLPAAVGRECGRKSFCRGGNRSTGRLGDGLLEVDVVRIDSMLDKFGNPDVIKIDVEGAEDLVLEGGQRCLARGPIVFLATHSDALEAKCSAMLTSAGYESKRIEDNEFIFTRGDV